MFAQINPVVDKTGQTQSTDDREKLRGALIAAQESAAVQILLECCLPKDDNEKVFQLDTVKLLILTAVELYSQSMQCI